MDNPVFLEEDREVRVVPARDHRLGRAGASYRGVPLCGGTVLGFDGSHSGAARGPIHVRVAQLDLIVRYERFGERSTRVSETRGRCRHSQGANQAFHDDLPQQASTTIAPEEICQSRPGPGQPRFVTDVLESKAPGPVVVKSP